MPRQWLLVVLLSCVLAISAISGCRGRQRAHVLKQDDKDMVGSHTAGAETWKPLIDESVGRLLAKSCATVQQDFGTAIIFQHRDRAVPDVMIEPLHSDCDRLRWFVLAAFRSCGKNCFEHPSQQKRRIVIGFREMPQQIRMMPVVRGKQVVECQLNDRFGLSRIRASGVSGGRQSLQFSQQEIPQHGGRPSAHRIAKQFIQAAAKPCTGSPLRKVEIAQQISERIGVDRGWSADCRRFSGTHAG